MVSNIIPNDDMMVRFNAENHEYFTREGIKLKSVSQLIKVFIPQFEADKISSIMARAKAKEDGISEAEAKRIILSEWDEKRESAGTYGTGIHDNLEKFLLTGKCDPEYAKAGETIHQLVKGSYRYFCEQRLYSIPFGIAGTADLVVQRQKTKNSLIDFFDYKTNQSKGIVFDSIGRKTEDLRHYNRMMLPPLDHLEDCNYVHYCLQLSSYAYMAESTWGIKVGRLAIIFIDKDANITIIPVPYMKLEIIAMMTFNLQLKPLPPVTTKQYPVTKEECHKAETDNEDDW